MQVRVFYVRIDRICVRTHLANNAPESDRRGSSHHEAAATHGLLDLSKQVTLPSHFWPHPSWKSNACCLAHNAMTGDQLRDPGAVAKGFPNQSLLDEVAHERPSADSRNASMSALSAIALSVGFPAPCPADVSILMIAG